MLERSRTWMLRSVVLTAIGAAAACSSSGSAPSGSSSQAAAGPSLAAAPAWASPANFVGRVEATAPVSIQVHLAMRDLEGAKALLADVSDPDSAHYMQFLSDADFASRFAPTAADVAVVRAHLEGHGLTVTDVPSNNAYLAVSGAASRVEAAFSIRLGQ